jgi:hypothetical protein
VVEDFIALETKSKGIKNKLHPLAENSLYFKIKSPTFACDENL